VIKVAQLFSRSIIIYFIFELAEVYMSYSDEHFRVAWYEVVNVPNLYGRTALR